MARRGVRVITSDGKTKHLREWAEEYGVDYAVVLSRWHKGERNFAKLIAPRHIPNRNPEEIMDPEIPWEQDSFARWVVEKNPDGLSLEYVGLLLGVTRERVRQIELSACRKIALAASRHDPDAVRFLELLREKARMAAGDATEQ